MNYPMQSSGLGGLNTVQNMSDRNMMETLMANGGQRFAAGGISNIPRMAAGGVSTYTFNPITGQYTQTDGATAASSDVPKYVYDPLTQKYTLVTGKKDNLASSEGGVDSSGGGSEPPTQSPFSQLSPSEKSTFFADPKNSLHQAISLLGQKGIGFTTLGMAQNALVPDFVKEVDTYTRGIDPGTGLQNQGVRGQTGLHGDYGVFDRSGNLLGYNPSSYQSPYSAPSYDPFAGISSRQEAQAEQGGGVAQSGLSSAFDGATQSETGNTAGGGGAESEARGGLNLNGKYYPPKYAQGGLSALAQGGMSNLGDYSDGGRLLRGPGDGVSDSIPATIANKQPARLADGEFVVPARIVSELGNGSTEAGARKLYQMLARVQNARKKSIGQGRVAVNSRAEKLLPA